MIEIPYAKITITSTTVESAGSFFILKKTFSKYPKKIDFEWKLKKYPSNLFDFFGVRYLWNYDLIRMNIVNEE